MPRDLHGTDPVLGYSHGNDIKGSTAYPQRSARLAGVRMAEQALLTASSREEDVDRAGLREVLQALGLKELDKAVYNLDETG